MNEFMENLEEQTKDAINILQLLMVELSVNEDDSHIIRTVAIVEKMMQAHLKEISCYCENIRQSISEP